MERRSKQFADAEQRLYHSVPRQAAAPGEGERGARRLPLRVPRADPPCLRFTSPGRLFVRGSGAFLSTYEVAGSQPVPGSDVVVEFCAAARDLSGQHWCVSAIDHAGRQSGFAFGTFTGAGMLKADGVRIRAVGPHPVTAAYLAEDRVYRIEREGTKESRWYVDGALVLSVPYARLRTLGLHGPAGQLGGCAARATAHVSLEYAHYGVSEFDAPAVRPAPELTVVYQADTLPSLASPPWTGDVTGGVTLTPGVLHIDNGASDIARYRRLEPGLTADTDAVLETHFRYRWGAHIGLAMSDDQGRNVGLGFLDGRVYFGHPGDPDLDPREVGFDPYAWHVYRIEKHGDSEVRLHVDGRLTAARSYAGLLVLPYFTSCIRFGGGHPSLPAYGDFAYVGYRIGGWGGASPPGGPGPDIRDPVDHGPPATQPPQWFEPLTARERAVARLIAQGLSNKQIAARLAVAEGTAERHVANILGKLAVRSRVEVAMWVVAQRWEDERAPPQG